VVSRVGNRILIIKTGALGDTVMSLPLLKALKDRSADITWVAGQAMRPLIELIPEIDRVVYVSEHGLFRAGIFARAATIFKLWLAIGFKPYDQIYILHSDIRYRILQPPWQLAQSRRFFPMSNYHHSFEYLRLGFPQADAAPNQVEPYVWNGFSSKADVRTEQTEIVAPSGRQPRICLFPGGAGNFMRESPLRHWPVAHYLELCRRLLKSGYAVSILGGPGDEWLEQEFAALRSQVDWQVARLPLQDTIRYLATSQAAVVHDGGPMHFASFADCPVVSLFGPTQPERFAPFKYQKHALVLAEKLSCQPCYDGRNFAICGQNRCMELLTVERVFHEVTQLASPQSRPVT
jgi:heptosyltransferase-2